MDTPPHLDRLGQALAANGNASPGSAIAALAERTLRALRADPGADGLPDLSFLSSRQQAAVLTVVYSDFFARWRTS